MGEPTPIHLGNYFDSASGKSGQELAYDGERHVLLFGPNGTGKGTRLLVPNLLRLRDRSIIVIDPKGELAAITAAERRRHGKVVILNPFDVLSLGTSRFNPLAALNPESPVFLDDAAGLAEAIVPHDPNEKEPHWSDSARALITALIMWEVKVARHNQREPSMQEVRYLLTQPDEYEGSGKDRHQVAGLRITAQRMAAQGGFEIESLSGRFTRGNDEIASIQSTGDRHTHWILSQLLRENMAASDFDFASLNEEPTTVYLVLPAERIQSYARWLRLIVISALNALYRPGRIKTLFMMDEFAQLGHLGPIENALGMARGYGIQMWPVLQDLNQLKALYKERWETFIANAGIVQAFTPNDLTTAEWMSQRAGEATVAAAGFNQGDSQSMGGQGSQSSGLSYSQARRRLFLPQELMDMPEGSGLLWVAGTAKSIPFMALPYWKMECGARANPNPYYAASTGPAEQSAAQGKRRGFFQTIWQVLVGIEQRRRARVRRNREFVKRQFGKLWRLLTGK